MPLFDEKISEAKLGFNARLRRSDGASPPTFTTIAEIFDIAEIGETAPLVEVTHHQSPDARREYIQGLKDGDEFAIQANYVPTNTTQDDDTGILSVFDTGARDSYEILSPDDDIGLSFDAIVLHWGINFNLEDRQVLNVNFKVTSKINFFTPEV